MAKESETGPVGRVDLRGLECPYALAALDAAMSENDALRWEALTDHHTTAWVTVPAYCREHGYDLATREEYTGVSPRLWRLHISREGSANSQPPQ